MQLNKHSASAPSVSHCNPIIFSQLSRVVYCAFKVQLGLSLGHRNQRLSRIICIQFCASQLIYISISEQLDAHSHKVFVVEIFEAFLLPLAKKACPSCSSPNTVVRTSKRDRSIFSIFYFNDLCVQYTMQYYLCIFAKLTSVLSNCFPYNVHFKWS